MAMNKVNQLTKLEERTRAFSRVPLLATELLVVFTRKKMTILWKAIHIRFWNNEAERMHA